jgi:hypothetical protein
MITSLKYEIDDDEEGSDGLGVAEKRRQRLIRKHASADKRLSRGDLPKGAFLPGSYPRKITA